MNYTKALERIRGKLMENPDTAKRISDAEKLAQDELDRQESTKSGGYKVIMALLVKKRAAQPPCREYG